MEQLSTIHLTTLHYFALGILIVSGAVAFDGQPLAPIVDGADHRGLGRNGDPGLGEIPNEISC